MIEKVAAEEDESETEEAAGEHEDKRSGKATKENKIGLLKRMPYFSSMAIFFQFEITPVIHGPKNR